MFGDPKQCKPVEGGSQTYYDYLTTISVRQMCPNFETLEHIVNSENCDEKTLHMLDSPKLTPISNLRSQKYNKEKMLPF